NTFAYPVASNRNARVDLLNPGTAPFNSRNLVGFTATDGGGTALEVITGNASNNTNAFWRTNFDKSFLSSKGDSAIYNVTATDADTGKSLLQALTEQLASNRERFLNSPS